MKKTTVSFAQAVTAPEAVLPVRVQEALGELVGEQVETEARSTSKSAVSRQFVARTRENLEALMRRRLDDVRLAVLMVAGIDLKGRTNVVAGRARARTPPSPPRCSPTRRARASASAGRRARPLPSRRRRLAVRGPRGDAHRLQRLGILGNLKATLASTNPCESMIECVRRTSRNVKRWRSGEMCLRWTAAGMLEAERQFRRVIGYRDLAQLAVAIERDLTGPTIPILTKEAVKLIRD